VHSVSWYDAVKWCNARSEMETLAPCYRESGVVYRAGSAGSLTCDWSASGFRLPSEAEWERAARGGSGGKRFPWGDTIDHSRANCYLGYPGFPYAGASNGSYHPEYRTGRDPYTAPVGMFPANGYGLYDTSGNIMEWCWNWYVPDDSSSPTDPHGPENGKLRVCRGGGWHSNADDCRNAVRSRSDPGGFSNHLGFRIARAATP
jgi:formylglycine-generating enzyme required for sulfatase activity